VLPHLLITILHLFLLLTSLPLVTSTTTETDVGWEDTGPSTRSRRVSWMPDQSFRDTFSKAFRRMSEPILRVRRRSSVTGLEVRRGVFVLIWSPSHKFGLPVRRELSCLVFPVC
ncbi:hypothetical protein FOZ63_034160, partial [Perkinsus olseni]